VIKVKKVAMSTSALFQLRKMRISKMGEKGMKSKK